MRLKKSITALLTHRPVWTGTATELLKALPGTAKTASALMRSLNAMDAVGFRIDL